MFIQGSFKIAEIGGTDVRVHSTFLLLLAWIGTAHWLSDGPLAALSAVAFITILFLCVLLHEFGHILAARNFGIRTPHVTLLPIGGVASLERMPEKPMQEIVVALAGPLVTLAIALLLFAAVPGEHDLKRLTRLDDAGSSLLARVAAANAALFVFNLLPAFPMDGGRVLRALLATRLGHARATAIAASIGQTVAVGLALVGLLGNPVLILVAIFVFMAASGEAGYAQLQDAIRGRRVSAAMITSFRTLPLEATADDAVALLLSTTQQEMPVVDGDGRLRGLVTRKGLTETLGERGGAAPVREFMTPDVPTVPEGASLETAVELLHAKGAPVVGVTGASGRLVGYVNYENIAELIMVRSSIAPAARSRVPS